ncbi:MAG TPA: putative Ig domain-containing protein, partial [Blastocatellia bacterium]
TVTLAPATLPNGEVGNPYSQTVTASPAGGSYNYSVTNGALPAGLSLNASTGLISGTPSQTGTFNFRVTVTGFGSCTAFLNYQIIITTCAPITVSPTTLPGGTVGTGYSQTVSASPAGAYAFTVTNGVLPPGLSLNAATGVISGTPTTSGSFNFRVTAALDGCSGSRDYTVAIACPTLTLTPPTIVSGQAGVAYNQPISVSPAGSYTFSLALGNLPAGLTLNPATGVISGMPSSTGTTTFTVKAESAGGCSVTQSYSLVIGCPTVAINPATLPSGTAGTAYSQTITASPTGGNYTFAVTSGSLPAGLNLNPATGVLSGTPTTNGSFTFTVTATGFGACTGSQSYTVVIGSGGCSAVTLPAALPNGSVGALYSNAVAASPSGLYSYGVTAGSLPPGVTLFGSNGVIFGYPTAAGTYSFTITATQGACSGSQAYTVVIGAGFASSLTVFSDFDGDGKSDLSVFRGSDGNWLVANSGDGKVNSTPWGASYEPYNDVPVSGDYDGDGLTDLAVFRRGGGHAGYWFINRSSDGQVSSHFWGLPTDIPVPGDYDGDGKTDVAVWRGSAGAWYIVRSSDGGVEGSLWGAASAGDIPVPGDYDGDRKTDFAVFRRTDGHWLIKRSSDGSTFNAVWGVETDVPVPGDYDADGKTDLAVWRASDGNWYIIESSSAALRTVNLGVKGDFPVAADYDGDGKADAAVWQKAAGRWLIKQSSDDSLMSTTHGQPDDVPIMARRN